MRRRKIARTAENRSLVPAFAASIASAVTTPRGRTIPVNAFHPTALKVC